MLIILNGISKKRRRFYQEILPGLKPFQPMVEVTTHHGHARAIATAASLRGETLIFSAGGDGTLSQVVNGIMDAQVAVRPTVGVIPLGSGNDFARTLSMQANGTYIAGLIRRNEPRLMDVGMITLQDGRNQAVSKYFVNECSIGMGPEVVRRLVDSRKALGASISYLAAIVGTFFSNRPQQVHVRSKEFSWGGDARVVAVANGKAFAHSLFIAPNAEIDDGLLNVFVCKGIPSLKFLTYLQRIKKPKKIADPKWIDYRTVGEVEVHSGGAPLPVEADGELIGYTPLSCSLRRQSLKILM